MQAPITQLMDGASGEPLALRRSGSTAPAAEQGAQASAQEARAAEAQSAKEPPPTEELVERARDANKDLERLDHRLQFRVDEESGQVVVAVIDADTSEVLKQMPAEEMLEVARRLEEQLGDQGDATGVLLSDSA